MKLGLLTAPLPDVPLLEIADWASAQGFEELEVCTWPVSAGTNRRYAGITHIDVDGLTKDKGDEIVGELKKRNITMSALGYYPNNLHPDPAHRAAHVHQSVDARDVPRRAGASRRRVLLHRA